MSLGHFLNPVEAFTSELSRQMKEAEGLPETRYKARAIRDLGNISAGLSETLTLVRNIRHPPEDYATFQLVCDEGRGATDRALKLLRKGEDPEKSLLAANTAVGTMLSFARQHAGD